MPTDANRVGGQINRLGEIVDAGEGQRHVDPRAERGVSSARRGMNSISR